MTAPTDRRPLVSVMTPVFNEALTVQRCYDEVRRVMESMADRCDYEHIFADNRSTDETLSILRRLAASDPRVRVLAYSKNFGAEKSAMTAIRHARGDAAITIVADLQDPPDLIPTMFDAWREGYSVVYGVYENVAEGRVRRALRSFYYGLVERLSDDVLPRNFTGFALMDRRVVDEVARVDDFAPYIRGIVANVGFKQKELRYRLAARAAGESKHRAGFLLSFGMNGIISHSLVPLRLATLSGVVLAGTAILASILYAVVKLFFWEFQAPGATTVVVLLLFFFGVQLFFFGILGEYVGAIHAQVRRKPFVIIEEKIGFDDAERVPPLRVAVESERTTR
jgi:polyisoprenyl-phosphate glycosyltransferase